MNEDNSYAPLTPEKQLRILRARLDTCNRFSLEMQQLAILRAGEREEWMRRASAAELAYKPAKEIARRACTLGLAALGTYGARDESGLTGLSLKHWRELTELSAAISAL